ncbi:MAG TPA: hypothetical protein VLA34_06680, partial [Candidatus Krumholzibacterium sp.]|nr:hypothetical protein [Candidatus Krumholzibacterium sp.]
ARGMVTTSGGGFALMTEGLSLAGMIESPVVIHLAQRPGPATGLPTRTEQGDLLFALYGGHGYFPRIILAPGTIEEAYDLSRRAFGLADTLQVPVIILTDQYLIDSYTNVAGLDTSPVAGGAIVETKKDYSRYRITPDGISPRGVPGHGSGLVCVDSDEHDEDGRITESREVRTAMVEKRLRKSVKVREAAIEPVLTGGEDFRDLVVGWGSTCPIIRGGLDAAGVKDASFLHISQVYPMHPRVREYMEKAERVIVVENNVISQLGKVLLLETGLKPDAVILKYDGHPFSVEELAGRLSEVLQN